MENTNTLPQLSALLLAAGLLTLLSCATLSPVEGKALSFARAASPEEVSPRWQPFAAEAVDGLAYCAGKVSRPRIEFHALRVDLSRAELRIQAAGGAPGPAEGEFLSTKVSSFVRSKGLLAGINALPFQPVSGKEGELRTNIGIVVSNGVEVSLPHSGFDALVFYADGGAAIAAQSEIDSAEHIDNAVGGFRRILAVSELVPRVLNVQARHPRSAAGISSDGRYLYLLVIDGRRPGSIGSTEAETALVLRALGAAEGINFDGGGSTALALRYGDGKVRVVNTPIHGRIPGRERAVAGCLGIGITE